MDTVALKITHHSLFHKSIYTSIVIEAPIQKVWQELTDFEQLPTWSNGLQGLRGTLALGNRVAVDYLFRGKVVNVHHTISHYQEGQAFGWSDPLIPFAKDQHIYQLEAMDAQRTRLVQSDEIKGLSTIFVGRMLLKIMQESYPIFNQLLKKRVEQKL